MELGAGTLKYRTFDGDWSDLIGVEHFSVDYQTGVVIVADVCVPNCYEVSFDLKFAKRPKKVAQWKQDPLARFRGRR